MDKLYHFKGITKQGNLKHVTENSAGFYSEEEADDTPKLKPMEFKKSAFQPNETLSQLSSGSSFASADKKGGSNVDQLESNDDAVSTRGYSQTLNYSKPSHTNSTSSFIGAKVAKTIISLTPLACSP